tara:strand:+ start:1941 stop:2909 length:969 start_codon:yes stop_codon:yes gene_type:complete
MRGAREGATLARRVGLPPLDIVCGVDIQSEVAQHLARGRKLWRSERELERACAEFERAIELDPRCAQAFNDLGCLRTEQGDLDRALRSFFEARRLDPSLLEAKHNHTLLTSLLTEDSSVGDSPWTTISGSLLQGRGASFAEGLVRYLSERVGSHPGDEEARDDAIQDVVVRVLSLSKNEDLPLADALRQARRSSTRAWVRNLMSVARRRRGSPLPQDDVLLAEEEAVAPEASAGQVLRLDERLNRIREGLLTRSQSATRWRRRIVWDVFVGALAEGVRLQRKEVVAAVRELGVTKRRAKDSVLLGDLDLVSEALRKAGPGQS